MSGLKRVLGGGQLFLTQYTAPANGGFVAFTARLPGVIRELRIDPADNYMVQSDSYTCSTPDVEISVGIQKKLGAGIFGGGGVIFQRLSGKRDGVGADVRGDRRARLRRGPVDARPPRPPRVDPGRDAAGVRDGQGRQERAVRRLAAARPDVRTGPRLAAVDDPQKLAQAIEPYLPEKTTTTTTSSS
jgi:hypothetical protein